MWENVCPAAPRARASLGGRTRNVAAPPDLSLTQIRIGAGRACAGTGASEVGAAIADSGWFVGAGGSVAGKGTGAAGIDATAALGAAARRGHSPSFARA